MIENIKWFKQSGFLFDGTSNVYIDPWDIPAGYPKADIILITHAHADHFDISTIRNLAHKDTQIVAPHDVSIELKMEGCNVIKVGPEETQNILGINIEVFPAYNLNKSYHPRNNNWVGYIIDINGKRYYHAGDTDHIPEMSNIKCDVALLPIGGTYTMDVKEAVEAASVINPKLAVPMHYGFVVGKKEDGDMFKQKSTVPVELMLPIVSFER
ncbi:MAG: hypothetical protein A3A80_04295 [Candidatus Terrybacteria bacterium RIFCSPLOWO2_01_FULL_44_24]|uniref:MBL fold metallo-hydrolase n=1 Tax=Candidatus Terrybacteria bacterium RIFCSPHIGHO2_01_FULL_43_35 TaxID=1802361 RepID=A0A1G2PBZ8_9BACT|nr:MAG: hypothetical protein A2828_01170 [Candidatus Terrybacteria bacterium RIFCSPHIGHO2_01_FULL_43_35]OHA49641.1 MAG: hypothetical protein A3B75_00950 [Candidatus Terrybacteria bacterium RIFCSPHIGHO2_02_FULL_43_14]OHA51306.1 MAG: hypothetical protein A3A80_04295 [Candidatus Terrybacteria bacterium RIFCSPLOWO2_01_FULL_44_24]